MKKLLLIMFCMIILAGSVTAELTIIDNVGRDYDEETQTITVKNTFGLGRDIAKITLDTPINNVVGLGYQKVAQLTFDNYENHSNVFNKMQFYNKEDMDSITKTFDYKYKTFEFIDVEDYTQSCSLDKNGTNICSSQLIGTHQERKEVWNDFDDSILLKGNITLGIFTNVQEGDYVEWIPTYYGVKINEWATWTSDLNTNLINYYKLDDPIDEIATGVNMTNSGGVTFTTGLIGNNANGGIVNNGSHLTTTTPWVDGGIVAFSVWVNATAAPTVDHGILGTCNTASDVCYLLNYDDGGGTPVLQWNRLKNGVANGLITHTTTFPLNGSYQHIVVVYDGARSYLYFNGVQQATNTFSGNGSANPTAGSRIMENAQSTNRRFNGKIDEVGIWSRNLTQTEVTQLFNGGAGITHTEIFTSTITLNSPEDFFSTTTAIINFNATVTTESSDLDNVTLYINDVGNETNTSGTEGEYIFTKIFSDTTSTWIIEGCNPQGCTNSSTRTFTVDATSPTINIESPTESIDYLLKNTNITLNITATDFGGLDTCLLDYNNTNTTISCANATKTHTEFIYEAGFNNLTIYANDTLNNLASSFRNWTVKVLENSRNFNLTSFETKAETFTIDITANSSLTAVNLNYNGTIHSTTQSGTNYSATIDVPIGVFNNTVKWDFTYAGGTISSTQTNQDVSLTNFSICDTSLNIPFLNVSFKDESDFTTLNASIPLSSFVYYSGSGTVNRTYSFTNNTDNYEYNFCATPNQTLNVDPQIQYKQGTAYPQRVYDVAVQSYSNTTRQLVLQLLALVDGQFVTFQVINTANQVINGVEVVANRTINGVDTTVGQGTTSGGGAVTLWLSPNFIHDFQFSKSGFTTLSSSFAPTQSAYTITLAGGTATQINNYNQGITKSILPTNVSLTNDTTYTFGFNLTSSFWDLTSYGFNLRLVNGTVITGGSTTTSGTPLTFNYDTTNQSRIFLDFFWLIDGNYTNGTREWVVYNTLNTQWSISTFFKDFNIYMDSGFFGIDDFGRYFIVFLIIFFTIGIMSFKYGFTSPIVVSTMTFLIVFFFDFVVKIIPTLSVFGVEREGILTFITGTILVLLLMKEWTSR